MEISYPLLRKSESTEGKMRNRFEQFGHFYFSIFSSEPVLRFVFK